jgi:hypothetical protein
MNQTEAARSNQVRYICDNTHSYNRIRLQVQLTEAIALSTFRKLVERRNLQFMGGNPPYILNADGCNQVSTVLN